MSGTLLVEHLLTRSEAATSILAHGLYERWTEVEAIASVVAPGQTPEQMREAVEDAARDHDQFAWIGVASLEGRVLAATNGLLEGQDVSSRPWFRAGLQGPFAGDVHEAVMLQRVLQPDSPEPLRFVDFALPLVQDGAAYGVVGSHLDWRWVGEVIDEAKGPSGVDMLIISRDGTILLGPPAIQGKNLDLPSIRAAQQGAARTFVETWPDGVTYLAAVTPSVSYRNLPSFGWSVVARQRADDAAAPLRDAAFKALTGFAAGAALLVGFGVLAATWIATPVRKLALSAQRAVEGRYEEPIAEEGRYREAAQLSASLQHLQSRLTARSST